MPAPDGLEVLRAVADDPGRPEVVIMTGDASVDSAVQAMRLGAIAYLTKPYRMPELDAVVGRALERRRLTSEVLRLRSRVVHRDGADPLRTTTAAMRAVLAAADAAAEGDAPVLIVGPGGAGKHALAERLHAGGPRRYAPFLVLSAGELSAPEAVERVFGRAARGAQGELPGALAAPGTVYLADVTALGATLQRRLARALAAGEFRPEGATVAQPLRARVVAGTRRAPESLGGGLAAELLRELSRVRVTLPPLKERRADIAMLAGAYVAAATDGERLLDDAALAALTAHDWPGNADELRAVLDTALAVAPGRVLAAGDLALGAPTALPLAEVERRHIGLVLQACDWHQGRAAEALGISPKTLYRKIREYGFRRPESAEGA
jgi:DNA-binding NtrC family response regulator